MKVEETLEKANELWINPDKAAEIIRNNQMPRYAQMEVGKFLYVSGIHLLTNPLFQTTGKYPSQAGDCGIYWATSEGNVLAMASINLDEEDESLAVNQIQGTKFKYLTTNHQKRSLGFLPWESSLIEVAENMAKESGARKIKVISAKRLLEERAIEGFSKSPNQKTLTLRYDIPAIYRGLVPEDTGYYSKLLH